MPARAGVATGTHMPTVMPTALARGGRRRGPRGDGTSASMAPPRASPCILSYPSRPRASTSWTSRITSTSSSLQAASSRTPSGATSWTTPCSSTGRPPSSTASASRRCQHHRHSYHHGARDDSLVQRLRVGWAPKDLGDAFRLASGDRRRVASRAAARSSVGASAPYALVSSSTHASGEGGTSALGEGKPPGCGR